MKNITASSLTDNEFIFKYNTAPTASLTEVSTDEDNIIIIDPVLNTSDVDGDILTIISITETSNGTATIVDNKIQYVPNENFHGTDILEYTISDGNGGEVIKTLTITVTSVNDVPVVIAQESPIINEDSHILIHVLNEGGGHDG